MQVQLRKPSGAAFHPVWRSQCCQMTVLTLHSPVGLHLSGRLWPYCSLPSEPPTRHHCILCTGQDVSPRMVHGWATSSWGLQTWNNEDVPSPSVPMCLLCLCKPLSSQALPPAGLGLWSGSAEGPWAHRLSCALCSENNCFRERASRLKQPQ